MKANVMQELFDCFSDQLEKRGLITQSGSIVDASFLEASRQRNTRNENQEIKEGKTPEE